MRVQPRPSTGILVLAAYLAVFYAVWIVNDVTYDSIGRDASTLLRWYVMPLLCGAAVLVLATSSLGWWRPALVESGPRAPRWTLVPAVLMLVVAVVQVVGRDHSGTTSTMWLYLVVGSVGVGFCEELATRGVLLTGLRGRLTEPWAWFWSSALFGLLHLPNALFGAGSQALVQVVEAFAMGTALYLLRRGSGSLLWAMALHGLWDFSLFAGRDGPVWTGLVVLPLALLAVVLAGVLLARERGVRHDPREVSERLTTG